MEFKKIRPGVYEYRCQGCGRPVTLETDVTEKPGDAVKCFDCCIKFGEEKPIKIKGKVKK